MEQEAIKTDFPEYKRVSVADLVPYANNPRTHSAKQVEQIANSIREFGFLNPIITDGQNGIVAGHGRVMAAQHLGIESVPCIDAAHLTAAQRRAYVIADNKLADLAGWDNELLRVELDDLGAMGFDIELTGFSLGEVGAVGLGAGNDELGPGVDYQENFSVVVVCDGEAGQKATFERLKELGYDCRVLVN